jgi:hypothetical protein
MRFLCALGVLAVLKVCFLPLISLFLAWKAPILLGVLAIWSVKVGLVWRDKERCAPFDEKAVLFFAWGGVLYYYLSPRLLFIPLGSYLVATAGQVLYQRFFIREVPSVVVGVAADQDQDQVAIGSAVRKRVVS